MLVAMLPAARQERFAGHLLLDGEGQERLRAARALLGLDSVAVAPARGPAA